MSLPSLTKAVMQNGELVYVVSVDGLQSVLTNETVVRAMIADAEPLDVVWSRFDEASRRRA